MSSCNCVETGTCRSAPGLDKVPRAFVHQHVSFHYKAKAASLTRSPWQSVGSVRGLIRTSRWPLWSPRAAEHGLTGPVT